MLPELDRTGTLAEGGRDRSLRLVIGVVIRDWEPMAACVAAIRRAMAEATTCGIESTLIFKNNSGRPLPEQEIVQPEALVGNELNVGFGRAHNMLLAEAFDRARTPADWYFCLNPDTQADIDCLAAAAPHLREHALKLAVLEARQFPHEHPKPYDPFTGETAWCSGAAMFINRDTYLRVGGFDDNIFMYCEDVDLSWRVRSAGGKCLMLPSSLIAHQVDLYGTKPREIRRLMLEGARYLGAKWGAGQFYQRLTDMLVEEQFYPEAVYVPPMSVAPTSPHIHLTEFRQELSFCLPRW